MRTLRARTTLLATAVSAVVLAALAVLLLATLEARLTEGGDSVSRLRARELLEAVAAGGVPRVLDQPDDESVSQVLDRHGIVLSSSDNIAGRPGLVAPLSAAAPLAVRTVDGPDDRETENYRLWVGARDTPDGPVTVVVGRSTESVREAGATLRDTLVVTLPVALALLAAATWFVAGRALRRVDAVTRAVDAVTEVGAGRRVPESGVEDEVGRLARTMNTMLARLDDSSARQRAFVADASHDLQSPVTALRARLEVALAHPAAVGTTELAEDVLGSVGEMESLVGALVELARGERMTPVRREPLDLDALVLEEASRCSAGNRVTIDTRAVSAAPVLGDARDLRRLVRNLLDNAVRHASGRVAVRLHLEGGSAVLEVSDDGPGVPSALRAQIFDRFTRGDPTRVRDPAHPHYGLGLAIAAAVAERHDGLLELVGDQGSAFRLRLPTTPGPGRPADATAQ
ncbi:sensor histidine kinase [Phycicoccus avicenniae]|uniref:sensor histidine kinase n=1 Tax=Phycicoccus avicenniae TaxID=2828860 RepID=UPI003D2DA806